MPNPVKTAIESRISSSRFDSSRVVPEADIRELVRLATLAPSAYNCQNWRFIAVRTHGGKTALQAQAFGQPKVGGAAVVFIIVGKLDTVARLPGILQASVEAGVLAPDIAGRWLAMSCQSYDGNPERQRDEAFRSASLAAMTLMLAAQGMGLASCPMSGFDAAGVARAFALHASEIPVLLVAVGYPLAGGEARKPRQALDEVLAFV